MRALGWSSALTFVLGVAAPVAALRPDTPGTDAIFRYAESDVVEHFDVPGGRFRIHFTRAGANGVSATDADESLVPDHVEALGALYEEIYAFYTEELGFRAPLGDDAVADNGGDGRFDVYLLDFGGSADGSFRVDACDAAEAPQRCAGYLVQENDFVGYAYPSVTYANRVVASHELFHAIQAAYDHSEGTVLNEGTAVWATETFDPSLSDFEAFVDGYLDYADRPIDRPLPGPVDPFSYGAALFFRFLEEAYDRMVLTQLWIEVEADTWLSALDTVLAREHTSSFSEAFARFATWTLFTGVRADPSLSFEDGADYPARPIETSSLPLEARDLRVFHASSHAWSVVPDARDETVAALVGDRDGLGLMLAARRDETWTVSTLSSTGEARIDSDGTAEVLILLVNAAPEGSSRRPSLCAGSPEEVSACRASLEETPDAGVADASTPDTGTDDASVPDAPGGSGSGGCTVVPSRAPDNAPGLRCALFAVVGAMFGVLIRRR